jgi:hypothetical protein
MLSIFKFIFNPDWFTFSFGGGGGPTTTKSETSNIPEYARPYVERMMGSTEKQVYTYGPSGNITGFQPFQSYSEYAQKQGGTGETVAGFTPMQARAMQGIGQYQMPGQTAAATQLTGLGALSSLGAGQQYAQQATDPYAMQSYMSPYVQGALDPQMREAARQSAIEGQRQQAQAVQAGAFGGSRQGLVEAERQRNLAQLQSDIYGKGMQSAFEQARQAQQFGSELGLKGYGQALQGAGQLGALGEQQYKQELGLLGQQYDVGAKQQAYEQARLNQVIQDYATKQQYPFIQLGTLSNMLRGLPMQASTTQLYQAQPSFLQQGLGAAGAYANLKQAGVNMPFKEGGEIKEMASGGIASGVDRYKLPGMVEKLSDQQLEGKLGGDTDPETMGIAQAEKQRRDHIRKGMAGGGAVAFKEGGTDEVLNPFTKQEARREARKEAEKKQELPVEAPAVATRPKAAAPKPAPAPKGISYEGMLKEEMAKPSPIAPEIATLRGRQAEAEKEVALGVEGHMQRQQEAQKKFGIDPAAIFAQERAEQKKFLAQAEGDARKAEALRWAQMWAKFGSTPGPILKAGLTAINETIPDLLDDQKYARALQRSITKTLNDIDRAEYLDKKGRYDEAQKLLNSARENVVNYSIATSKLVADEYQNRIGAMSKLAAAEVGGKFDVLAARERAAAGGGGGLKETKEERLREQAIDKAFKDETKLIQDRLARMKSVPSEKFQKENAAAIAALEAQLASKREEIEARYRKQGAEKPKTLPPPTAEDIAHTAKKYGVSEEEVRKRLGI